MGLLLTILIILSASVAALKLYIKIITRRCKSHVCLVGKTAIVTGSNCGTWLCNTNKFALPFFVGIGYETALDFAQRGAKVILACRNKQKAEEARKKIIDETDNDNIIVRIIDMASFDSVRAFAKQINETEDRIDILVNNAGAVELEHKRTADGRALLMQVNYLSSFLLTNLLLGEDFL